MKGFVVGACISIAVIAIEHAAGIDLGLFRLAIIVPLCIIGGIAVADK